VAGPDAGPAARHRPRKVGPPPRRFGSLDSRIKAAALDLVDDFDGTGWPLYQAVADAYGFDFDDAVRALAEARRLAGEAE
jgi:hypothetical protein